MSDPISATPDESTPVEPQLQDQPRDVAGKFAVQPMQKTAKEATQEPGRQPEDQDGQPAPADGDWTPEHQAWARHFGMSEDQMKQVQPDVFLQMAQSSFATQTSPQAAAPVNYQVGTPSQVSAESPPAPAPLPAFEPPKLQLRDTDDAPPGLADFADQVGTQFERMNTELKDAIQQNQQLRQQLTDVTEQERYEVIYAQFDHAVDSLNETKYGRGRIGNLSAPHTMNRQALLDAVAREEQRLSGMGVTPPPLEVLVAGVDRQLSNSFAGPTIQKISDKTRDRSGQVTSPPASGSAEDRRTPRERAVEAATKAMKQHGMIP